MLAAVILYLYRIGDKERFDVNFRDVTLQQIIKDAETYFATHIPLNINVDPEQDFRTFYSTVMQQVGSEAAEPVYSAGMNTSPPGPPTVLSVA